MRPQSTRISSWLLALAIACMIPMHRTQAVDCPAKSMLMIKDSQEGFAGKTGTIWIIKPDCSFEVARFNGENVSAPHAKGQLTPEQQAQLAAVLSNQGVATLPEQTGQPAPVNSRQISIGYDGKTAVLDLGMGDEAARNLPDAAHRILEISKAVRGVTGQ